MRVPIVPILSTLQLHSGVVCCSPLPCAIMFDSSSVPRLFSVYDYVRFFIFLQTYDGKRCVPGTCAISHCSFAVISLLSTPPGAIITPPGVCNFNKRQKIYICFRTTLSTSSTLSTSLFP